MNCRYLNCGCWGLGIAVGQPEMTMSFRTRILRELRLLRLLAFLPLLCPPGLFQCGISCGASVAVAAAPEIAPACCHPSGTARDLTGGPCAGHEGKTAPGLKPGCFCPADSHLIAGPFPRRALDPAPSGTHAPHIAPLALRFPAEGTFPVAAASEGSPPGPGSQDTYLRIASFRI